MSRIGKLPIKLPENVTVEVKGREVVISGPKGSISYHLAHSVEVGVENGLLTVSSKSTTKEGSAVFGTTRAILANMIKGVADGWTKELELVGTGFRAEVAGNTLKLIVGYSHPVEVKAPEGIAFKVEKLVVGISGIDKELVGQMAAYIRSIRPPEPYKGKGIKYRDEVIRRKPGKAAAKMTPGA